MHFRVFRIIEICQEQLLFRSCEREVGPIASLELDGWQDSFGLMHNGPRDPNDYHYELLADA